MYMTEKDPLEGVAVEMPDLWLRDVSQLPWDQISEEALGFPLIFLGYAGSNQHRIGLHLLELTLPASPNLFKEWVTSRQ